MIMGRYFLEMFMRDIDDAVNYSFTRVRCVHYLSIRVTARTTKDLITPFLLYKKDLVSFLA